MKSFTFIFLFIEGELEVQFNNLINILKPSSSPPTSVLNKDLMILGEKFITIVNNTERVQGAKEVFKGKPKFYVLLM